MKQQSAHNGEKTLEAALFIPNWRDPHIALGVKQETYPWKTLKDEVRLTQGSEKDQVRWPIIDWILVTLEEHIDDDDSIDDEEGACKDNYTDGGYSH